MPYIRVEGKPWINIEVREEIPGESLFVVSNPVGYKGSYPANTEVEMCGHSFGVRGKTKAPFSFQKKEEIGFYWRKGFDTEEIWEVFSIEDLEKGFKTPEKVSIPDLEKV